MATEDPDQHPNQFFKPPKRPHKKKGILLFTTASPPQPALGACDLSNFPRRVHKSRGIYTTRLPANRHVPYSAPPLLQLPSPHPTISNCLLLKLLWPLRLLAQYLPQTIDSRVYPYSALLIPNLLHAHFIPLPPRPLFF